MKFNTKLFNFSTKEDTYLTPANLKNYTKILQNFHIISGYFYSFVCFPLLVNCFDEDCGQKPLGCWPNFALLK